jgi:Fe2+ transport system protein FeoA
MASKTVRSTGHKKKRNSEIMFSFEDTFSLLESTPGQVMKIFSLPRHGTLYYQFIRLGIHEGQTVTCYAKLPGGTVVLQKNRQYVSIGHTLARQVRVVFSSKG